MHITYERLQAAQSVVDAKESKRTTGIIPPRGFCMEVLALMQRYGIQQEWHIKDGRTLHSKRSWRQVMNRVKKVMEGEWRQSLLTTKGALYAQLKDRDEHGKIAWRAEDYLHRGRGALRIGGQWKLRMRCYSVELNAVRHIEHRGSPLCTVCDAEENESFAHFLLHCHLYDHIKERAMMITAARRAAVAHLEKPQIASMDGTAVRAIAPWPLASWDELSDDDRVVLLLSAQGAVDYFVRAFLTKAFTARAQALKRSI
jgi:hypothetical protein